MKLFFGLIACVALSGAIASAKQIDTIHKSTLHYFNGLYVLDLHGTREEMMYDHGFFAMKHLSAFSPVRYYSQVMDKVLNEKLSSRRAGFASRAIDYLLKKKMNLDDEKAYKSFAQGMGVPASMIAKALYYPEFVSLLTAYNYSTNDAFMDLSALGGSTVVTAKSDWSPAMLMGRNLEFGGVGYFDRYPAVIYLNSTDPRDQKYIQMTALGVPGTHTAYNESGLMISLHQMTVNQMKVTGDLILNVVDEVARRAKTLAEAKTIIQDKNFTTSWKIIVASDKENTGFVAEVSPRAQHFIAMESEGIAESNHATNKYFKDVEFFTSYNSLQSSVMRKAIMQQALKEHSLVDVPSMISLLRSRKDLKGGESSFLSMSKSNTIMSVVVSPSEQALYFGLANRINTKPTEGAYVKLPLVFGTNFADFNPEVYRSTTMASPVLLEVDNQIRAAIAESNRGGDLKVIADHIKKAVAYHGSDANLNNTYAAILLKLYGSVDAQKSDVYLTEATHILERNKSVVTDQNEKAVRDIVLARIAILRNNYSEAIQIYKLMTPTTSRMKAAVNSDLKILESNSSKGKALDSTRKMTISLTDLDVISF